MFSGTTGQRLTAMVYTAGPSDPEVGKGSDALDTHIPPGAQTRDTVTFFQDSHHVSPLIWSLGQMPAGVCEETLYQHHMSSCSVSSWISTNCPTVNCRICFQGCSLKTKEQFNVTRWNIKNPTLPTRVAQVLWQSRRPRSKAEYILTSH